jgi:phospholipase/lecithinase/hemolysin
LLLSPPAHAVDINDLFVFGDSYSNTGAYVKLTNGETAVWYLAQDFGITLTTSKTADPGTDGVNFAQSGARVFVGPTPPATQPLSLTQQVAQFQAYVQSGDVTFNPSTSLFFLLGGLNDHNLVTSAQVNAATEQQVATLYSLGARVFEIALLPADIPGFTDSAANLNPGYTALAPELQALFPDATLGSAIGGLTTIKSSIIRQIMGSRTRPTLATIFSPVRPRRFVRRQTSTSTITIPTRLTRSIRSSAANSIRRS